MRLGGGQNTVTTLSDVVVVYSLRGTGRKELKTEKTHIQDGAGGGEGGTGSRAVEVMDPTRPNLPCPVQLTR